MKLYVVNVSVYMYKYMFVLFYNKRVGCCKLLTNLKDTYRVYKYKIVFTGLRSRT